MSGAEYGASKAPRLFPRFINLLLIGYRPMTEAIDNQLIFEILKKVQSDVAVIKTDVAEVKSLI